MTRTMTSTMTRTSAGISRPGAAADAVVATWVAERKAAGRCLQSSHGHAVRVAKRFRSGGPVLADACP